jgi:hypothetical protein
MLRSLTLWHVDRVLQGAEGALRRRSALGTTEPGEDEALKAVTEFRASLPAPSKALRFSALAVAVLVVAHVLATLLLPILKHYAVPHIPSSAGINQLLDSTLSTLQLTVSSLDQLIDALQKVSVGVLAAVAWLVGLSLYAILWPVASAFRLKRLLLSLHPGAAGKLATTPASRSVTRAEGTYVLEREAFALLGARVPSEPPLDLLTSALVPACWIAFWAWFVAVASRGLAVLSTIGGHLNLGLVLTGAVILLLLLLLVLPPAALRLAWLAAAWRARTGPRSAWLLGDEVRVSWQPTLVQCWSPLLVGWLAWMCLFTFPVLLWLWWSTARDLRGLGREYGLDRLHHRNPLWQLPLWGQVLELVLVLVFFYLPLYPVILFFAARQVRQAQLAAGVDPPITRNVAWLGFVLPLPVQCVLLQRQLNRLWLAEATRTAPLHEGHRPVPA